MNIKTMAGVRSDRMKILMLSPMPPGQATIGAQRRIQGLLGFLNKHHDVTAVTLIAPGTDAAAAKRDLQSLCRHAVVLPARSFGRFGKRLAQVQSLVSADSFLRRLNSLPELQRILDEVLTGQRFDIVNVEFPFFSHYRLRQAPAGERPPRLVLDEHNVEHDLVRQMAGLKRGLGRHLHNSVDWRKLRREEVGAWRDFDGVLFTSALDEERARSLVPTLRARVIPNGVDVDQFSLRPDDLPTDGRTVLFFGTFNYFPNHDGALYFLKEIWPRLAASHPAARLKLIGANPPGDLLAFRGPRVEFPGLVDDIRRHIAEAAVAIVPLRIGGGTRLKVLESMSMSKAIVSTRLGAEGIEVEHGRQLLLADDRAGFAAAVGQVLDDRGLARRLGQAARELVENQYSWNTAGRDLEGFYRELLLEPLG